MRFAREVLAVVLSLVLTGIPIQGQETHVATRAAIDRALNDRAGQDEANRQAVLRVLKRPQVQELAKRLGLKVDRAGAAIATLQGAELQQLAGQAREVDSALAGGQSKVTISTTMLIIGLLLLILLIVAVK